MSNNKRATQSATTYIDQLFDKYSKLQVIRLDLYHKKTEEGPGELKELKKDVEHLIANSRSKRSLFGDMVGRITKFENGEERGPHVHTMLFFDGHKLQKDEHRGDEIGKYFVDAITKGKGSFHNANRNKENYERCGIGMIDHTNTEKRQALLEEVLPYLTKTDQSIDGIKASTKERAFTRGTLPRPKSKAGRPRLQPVESEIKTAVTTEGDSEDQAPTPTID